MLEMLRQYLRLIRLPNIFTAPSNVFVGYFALLPPAEANGIQFAGVAISSVLLYTSGIVFNDYFDLETDRRERPNRPLASGKIRKKHALILAVSAMAAANIVALAAAGPVGFGVSILLSALIFAYDYRLKSKFAVGTAAMASARSANVLLGATPAIAPYYFQPDVGISAGIGQLGLAMGSIFIYIVAVMILSRKEVQGASKGQSWAAASLVTAVILAIGILGQIMGFGPWYIPLLLAFAAAMALTFWHYRPVIGSSNSQRTQKVIRNMVLSIIVLDSVFVAGTAGLPYALGILLLVIPAVVLGRRMYVT